MTQGINETEMKQHFASKDVKVVKDAIECMWEPFIDFFSDVDDYEFITEVMK